MARSQFPIENLFGPGIIEQQIYNDNAKSRKVIDMICIPADSGSGTVVASLPTSGTTGSHPLGNSRAITGIGPGDFMRIVNGSAGITLKFIYRADDGSLVNGNDRNDLHIAISSDLRVIIPLTAERYWLVGTANAATVEFTQDN